MAELAAEPGAPTYAIICLCADTTLLRLLTRDHNDHEAVRLRRRPARRGGAGSRSWRCSGARRCLRFFKLGGGQIDGVSRRIGAHGPRAQGRFHSLNNFEFSRRGLAGNGERTITAACEGLAIEELGGVN